MSLPEIVFVCEDWEVCVLSSWRRRMMCVNLCFYAQMVLYICQNLRISFLHIWQCVIEEYERELSEPIDRQIVEMYSVYNKPVLGKK